ncbi:MAG: metal-binding protein [Burkholderiales bacterium RIFCSPLOWO2_12_FULL_61_40]|nr:MAG: metal-binding protein [Burkholderiales bacterium RIFCSPLOWO2_12_FULL_61_40]
MQAPLTLNRRHWLAAALMLPLAGRAAQPQSPLVEVWKDPSCGCCKDWVAIMEQAGFSVKVFETGNNAMRAQLGIPVELGSCHTARIAGYAIEGHVPVREIRRLLREKPKAVGLAVPGMVVGSPGMDGPVYKGRKDPYAVLLIQSNGKTSVYQKYA